MPSRLSDTERRSLLKLAREALVLAVKENRPMIVANPVAPFDTPSGAFVTLRHGKRLRGCIGRLDADDPMAQVVAHCAYAAAQDDPRFRPVGEDELAGLEIEISVLSAPAEIAPDEIQTGVHGLIVSRGHNRGVLLPQVAVEQRWDAVRFLEETCMKSGLPRDAWHDADTLIEAFTAEIFSENDYSSEKEPVGA